ncbi:MAG: M28 family peptidase [Acidobacteriota bacterium]
MKLFYIGYMQRAAFALVFISALAVQSLDQAAALAGLSAAENELVTKITVDSIKDITTTLASAEMQGRGTMQPGGDKAAAWIAERFQKLGLKPLGDKGGFLQKIDFKETQMAPESAFTVGTETFKMGDDYAVAPFTAADKTVSGDMVFVGYAMVNPKANVNDLGTVDVKGKIVVMLEGPPAGFPKADWEKAKASQIFLQNLIFKGVAGIVFIGHGREKNPPEELINYFSRRQVALASENTAVDFLPPFIYVSKSGAAKLLAKSGKTVKEAIASADSDGFAPIDLKQQAKINIKLKTTKGTSSNVVGFIEGSDPKLKEEAVVFSAHYDAYGTENGKTYFGAADNALGTAEMMAAAEAFSKLSARPKRTLIFLAVTGEEYGLYGSKYWAQNPTWNIKKVAANFNLDGIGSEVYGPVKTMVGYGAEHSSLGTMLGELAKTMQINVIPDPVPDEKVFYRSDHYSFVERGVPALMLLGAPAGEKEVWLKRIEAWEKTDYHNPGDVVLNNWSWEGAETVAEVMGILGWRVSEAPAMPTWLETSRFAKLERGNSKPLPEEK